MRGKFSLKTNCEMQALVFSHFEQAPYDIDLFTVQTPYLLGGWGGGGRTRLNYSESVGMWRNLNLCNSAAKRQIQTCKTPLVILLTSFAQQRTRTLHKAQRVKITYWKSPQVLIARVHWNLQISFTVVICGFCSPYFTIIILRELLFEKYSGYAQPNCNGAKWAKVPYIHCRVCCPTRRPQPIWGQKTRNGLSSDWFMVWFDSLTIGQISYFGVGLTTFD